MEQKMITRGSMSVWSKEFHTVNSRSDLRKEDKPQTPAKGQRQAQHLGDAVGILSLQSSEEGFHRRRRQRQAQQHTAVGPRQR